MSALQRAESAPLPGGGSGSLSARSIQLRVRIRSPNTDATKTIRFSRTVTVQEAITAIAEKANLSREEAPNPDDFVLFAAGEPLHEDDFLADHIQEDDFDSLVFESRRPTSVTVVGFGGAPRQSCALPSCQIVAEILEYVILKVFRYSPSAIGVTSLRDAILANSSEVGTFGLRKNKDKKENALDLKKNLISQGVRPDDVLFLSISSSKKKVKSSELTSKLIASRKGSLNPASNLSQTDQTNAGSAENGDTSGAPSMPKLLINNLSKLKSKAMSSLFATRLSTRIRRPVFGVSLSIPQPQPRSASKTASKARYIPDTIRRLIRFLRDKPATETEGLFRITASKSALDSFRNSIETDPDNFNPTDIPDPHIAANLLMLYLRTLPEPVVLPGITQKIFNVNPDAYETALPPLIGPEELPQAHRSLLRKILSMLNDVSRSEKTNMSAKSIAICVSPSMFGLMSSANTTLDSVGSRLQALTVALTWLIENYRTALPSSKRNRSVDESSEGQSAGGESTSGSTQDTAPTARRKSRLLLVSPSSSINPLDFGSVGSFEATQTATTPHEAPESSRQPVLPASWSEIIQSQALPQPDTFLIAEYDFQPEAEYEIPFEQGDILALYEMDPSGWCLGRVIAKAATAGNLELDLDSLITTAANATASIGLFPSTYCTPLVPRESKTSPSSLNITQSPSPRPNTEIPILESVLVPASSVFEAPAGPSLADLLARIDSLEKEVEKLKATPHSGANPPSTGGGLGFFYAALVGIIVAVVTNIYISLTR